MKRRIHNFYAALLYLFGADRKIKYLVDIGFIYGIGYPFDHPLLLKSAEIIPLYLRKGFDHAHLADYIPVLGRHNLPAVLPVYLVTVVFLRVMARGYYYSCYTTKRPYGIAQFRGGPHFAEDPCLNAV